MLLSEWESNVLGVDWRTSSSKLAAWYDFIERNHDHLPGDVIEFGVFKGRSLLATALLLQKLGSDKLVYGFDSFDGFPLDLVQHEMDSLHLFTEMHRGGTITDVHFRAHERLVHLRSSILGRPVKDCIDLSSSADFSATGIEVLMRKIELLGLRNVRLVEGAFSDSLTQESGKPDVVMAALLDCDLYESYWYALRYAWPKLVEGGFIFLDEYFSLKFPGARLAVSEFCNIVGASPVRLSGEFDGTAFERWGMYR